MLAKVIVGEASRKRCRPLFLQRFNGFWSVGQEDFLFYNLKRDFGWPFQGYDYYEKCILYIFTHSSCFLNTVEAINTKAYLFYLLMAYT